MTNSFRLAALVLLAAVSFAFAVPMGSTKSIAEQAVINFSAADATLNLASVLKPYNAPAGRETDGSRWYLIDAQNQSVRPMARVLIAADPPNAALRIIPRRDRPEILQVAASDSGVGVDRLRALGRHAFEVTIPPATSASLAIRVAYGDEPPVIEAWTLPALVAHNRQLSIFLAAVAGLIAAALAIMAGVFVITAHPAPGWTALVLLLVLLMRLQGAGVLDAGWFTALGGPYGLEAMLSGLTLAVAFCLTDLVAPLTDVWREARSWRKWVLFVVVALSLLAFVGAPGAAAATETMVLIGTAVITAYFVRRGLAGSKAARVMAPSAAIFALVAAVTGAISIGLLGARPEASGAVAGFTAAGAVLLALAVAAGEGIAILPIARDHAGQRATTGARPPAVRPLDDDADALAAIAASHQGMFDISFGTNAVILSREAAALLGVAGSKVISRSDWIARVHPDDRQVYRDAIENYHNHVGLAFRIEFRVQQRDGRYRWFELRATTKADDGGNHCLGLIADITLRKESEAAGADRTLHDGLTGLGNRIALVEDLEGMGKNWSHLVFAVLDVDRFKSIHASLGDAGGDQVLLGIASRVSKHFEDFARAYRIGGDSFALVLSGRRADDATSIGAEMMEICAAPFAISGRNVFVSASVGLATGQDSQDPLDLIRKAEQALELAKRQGGGCFKLFTRDLEATTRGDAVALETDLRRGLAGNEFAVHYQPIVRLDDSSVVGFEALLRWNHPQKGLVSPSDFIAHCEETGLIVALGRLALERAASDLADWQRYFPLTPPLFVSVNVSRRQLLDPNLESCLDRLLKTGKLALGSLKLELTESAVEAGAEVTSVFARLRALGAELAIDDFGTGLSTLSQLKDLPFETVKIDRSFLTALAAGRGTKDATAVMASIVALGRELKRTVIAEGIESEAEAHWLKGLGCEFGQGFYFSRPMPGHDVLKYIALHLHVDARTEGFARSSGAAGVG